MFHAFIRFMQNYAPHFRSFRSLFFRPAVDFSLPGENTVTLRCLSDQKGVLSGNDGFSGCSSDSSSGSSLLSGYGTRWTPRKTT